MNSRKESQEYLFSVIIPTYNRPQLLTKTLECLDRQTLGFDFEVIVIDDFSSPNSLDLALGRGKRSSWKMLHNEKNLGRASTRNRGIREAQGKYILMIDDDILPCEHLIEEHYNKHKQYNEEIVVVGGILPAQEIPLTAINESLNNHHKWCYGEMIKQRDYLPYNFLKTANVSIPRSLLFRVGLFDETFKVYGNEDTELGKRLSRNGIKILFAENAVGYHYHDETAYTIIKKELERVVSTLVYQKLHPSDIMDYNGFFNPCYHPAKSVRLFLYNLVKVIAFTPVARYINNKIINWFDKSNKFRRLLVRYLIPLLKIQYQKKCISELKNENRNRN